MRPLREPQRPIRVVPARRAVVLVIVNVAIAGAIYLPFVRAYERQCA